ncbi:MAG: hypothetical protein ACREVV_16005 [Steroidobacteraceae bacterium]
MNELDIIQQQLATERRHFAEVAGACASALRSAGTAQGREFLQACDGYFHFALARLEANPGHQALQRLATARETDACEAGARWHEFLQFCSAAWRRRCDSLDAAFQDNLPVAQWRDLAGIDADSILAERALFARVKATLPPGIALAAAAPAPSHD